MSETPNSSAKKQPKSAGSSGLIKFILLLTILASGGLAWLFMSSSNTDEIAVIRSPENPIRVKPVNEGGRDIPHQNSRVLDMIDDLNNKDDAVETIVLGDEQPEMPPAPLQDSPQSIMIATPDEDKLNAETVKNADQNIAENNPKDNASAPNQTTAPNTKDSPSDRQENPDADIVSDTADAQDNPVELMPKQRPVQPTRKLDSNTEIQLFTIQVAAFRSLEKAEKTAALLNEKHKDRMNNISLGIVRADNSNGVTYWRVTSEPVRKEDATEVCSKLNKAGQDCIVKKAGE